MGKNRWYDKFENIERAFDKLQMLDEEAQEEISVEIERIANYLKEKYREAEEVPLSIGKKRVLGLYQIGHSRRWYDKYPHLSRAIATISTLPESDYKNIIDGIDQSL